VTVSSAGAVAARRSREVLDFIPALDGFRGVAVMLVLAFHLFQDRDALHGYVRRALFAVDASWVGVDMFFVLSGFLITRILLSTKSSPRYFRTFYARRFLRIFPLYYGVLLVVILILPRVLPTSPGINILLSKQWMLWTYTMNYDTFAFGAGWIVLLHLWSVCIEEQVYLLWPAAVFFLSTRRLRIACWTLIGAAPAIRLCFLLLGDPYSHYFITSCRSDELAMGGLVALGVMEGRIGAMARLARIALPVTAAALGVLTVSGSLNVVGQAAMTKGAILSKCLSFSIIGPFFASVLILLLQPLPGTGWILKFFNLRGWRWIGKYSYGIYLLHYTIAPIASILFPLSEIQALIADAFLARLIYFLLASSLAIAAAFAAWHLWEKHFLSMKRWFLY
jgi:peptidoglycan/LPS O-acetylase OafA/YrhL